MKIARGIPALYPAYSSTLRSLDRIAARLGVSFYRMTKLLGFEVASNAYKWKGMSRRPSGENWRKMAELLLLQAEGVVDFATVHSIRWTVDGSIDRVIYKNEVANVRGNGEHVLPDAKWEVPNDQGPRKG